MKFPYFPFYVNDFAADSKVEGMALIEVGAYMFLLCKAWMEDPPGTLPDDDRILGRWSRLFDHWPEHKNYVMAPFYLGQDNRWHQKRMEAVYADLCSRNATASAKARAAALKRWKNAPSIQKPCSKHDKPMLGAMLEQCKSNSNPNISTDKYIPAEIPSEAEVVKFGESGPMVIAKGRIPADFCRYYHDEKETKRSWLNGQNRLIDWNREIYKWWEGRKHTWGNGAKSKTSKPPPENQIKIKEVKV